MTLMTAEQFSSQFCLSPLVSTPHETRFRFNADSKFAAVLVPIVVRASGLQVLLTKRASHLRHHPNQISFPGGKQDDTDTDLTVTALREAHEEIGLLPERVTPLGWLENHHTISNFQIAPLVGLIKNINPLLANEDEVAEIFEVPLSFFIERKNHHTLRPKFENKEFQVHFMPFEDKLIWGATAAILHKLALHFE